MSTELRLFISELVLTGLGVVMLAKPQLVYKLTEGWKYGDARKQSKLHLKLHLWEARFSGVIFTLVGIASLIHRFLPR